MRTNIGTRKIDKIVNIPGMGSTIWYDENSMVNIFSFGDLVYKYRILYDSSMEDEFYLHGENKVIKFPRSNEGFYFHRFNDRYKNRIKELNRVIEENIKTTINLKEEFKKQIDTNKVLVSRLKKF